MDSILKVVHISINPINRMKRGGHTFSFGKPNEYKAPKRKNTFVASSTFMQRLRGFIFLRKKAKAARAARKITRPTY